MAGKFKVGDKIQHASGSKYKVVHKESDTQYAVTSDEGQLYVIKGGQLDYYTKVPTFFQVGETYKFSGTGTDTYEVVELYKNTNPTDSSYKEQALVRVYYYGEGKSHLTLLCTEDFKYMVKA